MFSWATNQQKYGGAANFHTGCVFLILRNPCSVTSDSELHDIN